MKRELPKHTERYVQWSDSGQFNNLYYLIGYAPDSLETFDLIYQDALKLDQFDFKKGDTICSKVSDSSCKKNFTIMILKFEGVKQDLEGYREIPDLRYIDVRGY